MPDAEKNAAPKVTLTVTMTPDEYVRLDRDAKWDGMTVARYLVEHALGRTRRGC